MEKHQIIVVTMLDGCMLYIYAQGAARYNSYPVSQIASITRCEMTQEEVDEAIQENIQATLTLESAVEETQW